MPIFISYSHDDSDFAVKLASQLVEQNIRVWIDKWEMHIGDSIVSKIEGAIEGASALLVILSKKSVESEWCKQELNAGIIRELDEKQVVVLPVLVEKCKIPMFLRTKLYADFTKNPDEALSQLMDAIARVTNPNLQRTIEADPTLFLDWSVASKLNESQLVEIEITIAEHSTEQPYTVLTQCLMILDERATRRFIEYTQIGVIDFHRSVHLLSLAEFATQNDIRLMLVDENKQSLNNIILRDPKSRTDILVEIVSRRLGQDTGRNILIDIGGQFKRLVELQRAIIGELSQEQWTKMREIRSRYEV